MLQSLEISNEIIFDVKPDMSWSITAIAAAPVNTNKGETRTAAIFRYHCFGPRKHNSPLLPAFRDVIDVPLVLRRLHKSRKEEGEGAAAA